MRVLMLYQADKTGDAERGMFELCAHSNFDWSVALFATQPCKMRFASLGKAVDVVASHGFDVLHDDNVFRGVLNFASKIRGVVKRLAKAGRESDVILMSGYSALAMAAGGVAGAMTGRPVIWYVQDVINDQRIGKWELMALRAVSKWLVSGVIFTSQAARQSFVSQVGAPSSNMDVIHPGVSPAAFDDAMRYTKAEVRAMFGLPDDAYVLGCFDCLSPRKGQHVLLDALAKDGDAHVVMSGAVAPGEENYAAELRLKIQALGLTHRVHFVGGHVDVSMLMRAVDAVVNAATEPSAFDRNVVSGMLASVPVIASRLGGNPEIVQHMKCGILVKPEDSEGFLRSMQMLRNNPAFAERLGKEAALRGRSRFLPETGVHSITSALRRYAVARRTRHAWADLQPVTGGVDSVPMADAVK